MKRRDFVAGLHAAALVGPRTAFAQTSKVYRLGTLVLGPPLDPATGLTAVLIKTLAERGYVLGQNLIYDGRGSGNEGNMLAQKMQELKAANIDVVVVAGYPPALAAKASGTPTVVAFGTGDPVATGLVDSLARPGGNVTGISDSATTLSTKRLSLLKELTPNLRRVAMIWNKDDLGMSLRYEAAAKAAQSIGVTVQPLGVREPNDFNDAFTAMDNDPPDSILMVADYLTLLNRQRIFEFAAAKRLPAIYEYDGQTRTGGLMSYGPDLREMFGRAAVLVDRIFNGARPADLSFEQPTRYRFMLNLKTAKAMGLTVPNTLLALADEVIE
jgi:putative ABC transport system substrate-binding protein